MKRHSLMIILLLALGGGAAWAQNITGAITGRVSDGTGAVIPGAKVSATNVETSVVTQTTTNSAGLYAFPLLPPGNYQLQIEAAGFKAYLRHGLTLGAAQTLAVDARLEPGALGEQVTVTEEAPILKTEGAALGNNFDKGKFENLPVGRSVTSVLRVVPGVVPN
ncbi:MAG: carboxypeptidase-like regulatory domain-containing protein, partial [Burkholderiales bacterium]